jgi:hypothetical protein
MIGNEKWKLILPPHSGLRVRLQPDESLHSQRSAEATMQGEALASGCLIPTERFDVT